MLDANIMFFVEDVFRKVMHDDDDEFYIFCKILQRVAVVNCLSSQPAVSMKI